jgi:ligand-binding sensor domain-containing protein
MSVWKNVKALIPAVAMILLLLTMGNQHTAAQDLTYRQYTIRDGLAGSVIYDMVQDRNGYTWFATPQGVSRFDGQTFKHFSRENGLPDNEIIKLYLDKFNNVWFVSFVGFVSLYHNGRIIQLKDVSGVIDITEDFAKDSILLLRSPDKDSTNLFGQYRSLNANGKWKFVGDMKYIIDDHNLRDFSLLRTSSPAGTRYYFGSLDLQQNFVEVRTANSSKRYYFPRSELSDAPAMSMRRFYNLTIDKKGMIFHSWDSIYYVDATKIKPIIALRDPRLNVRLFGDVNSLLCENDSTLWICTRDQGLLLIRNFLDPQRLTIEKFFTNVSCTDILIDHENGYWIATYSDGVYYMPNLDFRVIRGEKDIYTKEVRSLRVLDDERIAAGFADGHLVEINSKNLGTHDNNAWFSKYKNVRVLDILPWRQKSMLVVSDMGTFIVSGNQISKNITTYLAHKDAYIPSNNLILVAAAVGVLKITMQPYSERKVFFLRTTCIAGLGERAFFGTNNGVFEYFNDSLIKMADKFPKLSGIIANLHAAADSSLWISTGQGLLIVKNDSVYNITKDHGLLSNICKHVTLDTQTAWVATDQGISKIGFRWQGKKLTYTISSITELDGLTSNDVNQTVLVGDKLFAATAKGIGYFPKSFIGEYAPAPLININSVRIGDSTSAKQDSVMIDRRGNRLTVELAGISYKSGRQISYEYRIKGLNDQWTEITNNTIELTAIPFGEYLLEARAVDRWGNKSITPRQIAISNPPPFWKSAWFTVSSYIFLALLLGAAFYFYYRYEQRKRDANFRLKKKVQDLEILALRTQINPHFIFNCLSSIQYYIQQADMENSNMYLFKFSLLIRKILKNSSVSTITLQEELQILELYLELEKLRLGDRMQYQVKIDEELLGNTYYIHSMIIQPYIENAIKHGIAPLQYRQGELNIHFKKSEKYIECFIEDNGIGINASMANNKGFVVTEHESMGAGITGSRINTINAMNKNKILLTVLDKSAVEVAGTGTIVHLSFPLITD